MALLTANETERIDGDITVERTVTLKFCGLALWRYIYRCDAGNAEKRKEIGFTAYPTDAPGFFDGEFGDDD